MEGLEPGLADGEERLVDLRPRTRSNPEGAEDRRSSNGSLGGGVGGVGGMVGAVGGLGPGGVGNVGGGGGVGSGSQPSVGNRVDGEGEASTSSSPPSMPTPTPPVMAASSGGGATAAQPMMVAASPAAAAASANASSSSSSSSSVATTAAAAVAAVAIATPTPIPTPAPSAILNAAATAGTGAVSKERPKPSAQSALSAATQMNATADSSLRAPRVNCPEKVIICLDLSEEMSLQKLESFNGSKTNALNISQKMIEMFVRTKHKIDKRHEFALVVVNDDALWLSGFTSDPRELCSCLYDLETNMCESFNLEDLLNVILPKIELPLMENVQTIPPPFVVRTILIYSRHAGQLQFNPSDAVNKMLQSPYFFFDVVYLHNGADEQAEENSWRDIYASFCNLDSKGMCYSFEVSLCGPALELHNCMAKLLSHPLQRPAQSQASYSLLEDDEAPEVEATV
ncbi:BRISC and BRCA1-A complex member 1 [Engraulis encrasicolus]|uniref:BRISC and BRCA1-A complex member 1 n=1 Tax=Engraulis encrasicolus TaxID=184585 RepID=UPI002FD3C91A